MAHPNCRLPTSQALGRRTMTTIAYAIQKTWPILDIQQQIKFLAGY